MLANVALAVLFVVEVELVLVELVLVAFEKVALKLGYSYWFRAFTRTR